MWGVGGLLGGGPLGTVGIGDLIRRFQVIQREWAHTLSAHVG